MNKMKRALLVTIVTLLSAVASWASAPDLTNSAASYQTVRLRPHTRHHAHKVGKRPKPHHAPRHRHA